MLRRFLVDLSSSARTSSKLRRPLSSKTHLIHRNAFSSAPKVSPAKLSKPSPGEPRSGAGVSAKLLLGGVVVGVAFMAAREAGYIDIGMPGSGRDNTVMNDSSVRNLNSAEIVGESVDNTVKETMEEPPVSAEGSSEELTSKPEELPGNHDGELLGVPEGDVLREVDELDMNSDRSSEESVDTVSSALQIESLSEENKPAVPMETEVEVRPHVETPAPEETIEEKVASEEQVIAHEETKDSTGIENDAPESLAKSYLLQGEDDTEISSEEISTTSTPFLEEEDSVVVTDVPKSRDQPADEKIVLDLIQAIHIAEKRQAESDFRIFEEEKRLLKDKYEKELRDARARELMYAEEAALMEKELSKEKTKSAAAIKTLQEKAEQNLRNELQQKEEEAKMQLKKAKELAKAELNAAVASEKSSQMEKIAEADLHINALCMAFYARSEEARQNHSVHKLALGAIALEEALSKGLPIRGEIEILLESLVDIRSDLLIDLVLASLPSEALNYGTDTKLQLNQKFDALKGTVRHFSLIPPGGGGILTHAVARLASFIKVREYNTSGAGIESVISRVEKLLAEGKLSEAADALEQGVSGTEAEGAIGEWVRQTKNRAIVEQAVTLIRSYTTTISLS